MHYRYKSDFQRAAVGTLSSKREFLHIEAVI